MSETLIKQSIKFDSFPLERRRYVEVVETQVEGGLKVRNEIEDIFRNRALLLLPPYSIIYSTIILNNLAVHYYSFLKTTI